jgi:hypothetical protein
MLGCRLVLSCPGMSSRRLLALGRTTQARPSLPPGGCLSRLPSAAFRRRALTLSRRSVAPALTGSLRLCGLAGPKPGGPRYMSRASQAAHTADPHACGLRFGSGVTMREDRIGAADQAVMRGYFQIIRRPSGPPLACFSACNAYHCLTHCHAGVAVFQQVIHIAGAPHALRTHAEQLEAKRRPQAPLSSDDAAPAEHDLLRLDNLGYECWVRGDCLVPMWWRLTARGRCDRLTLLSNC